LRGLAPRVRNLSGLLARLGIIGIPNVNMSGPEDYEPSLHLVWNFCASIREVVDTGKLTAVLALLQLESDAILNFLVDLMNLAIEELFCEIFRAAVDAQLSRIPVSLPIRVKILASLRHPAQCCRERPSGLTRLNTSEQYLLLLPPPSRSV
jgi:hypothetical protein